MSEIDRKAFLFVAGQFEGYKIDWATGRLIPPRQQG